MYDKHVATITSQTLWQVNKIGSWQATISFAGTSPPWVKSKKEKKKKKQAKNKKSKVDLCTCVQISSKASISEYIRAKMISSKCSTVERKPRYWKDVAISIELGYDKIFVFISMNKQDRFIIQGFDIDL